MAVRMSPDVLILASSDMSNSDQAAITRKVIMAIHKISSLDPEGLYHVVMEYDIAIGGFGTTVAMRTA